MEAFLQMLKDAGYTGEPTVEAISAWLAANPTRCPSPVIGRNCSSRPPPRFPPSRSRSTPAPS